MAALVDVVIPFRGGCEWRERSLAWVSARWSELGHQVFVGHLDDGPWCKARAVASALDRSTADRVIIADADVWCGPVEVPETGWHVPHGLVHRLDAPSTLDMLAGAPPGGTFDQQPYKGHPGGGVVALPRSVYEDCPLDVRYEGWGQEDDSWALALSTLHGPPTRGGADLWHLWHPHPARESRVIGSAASRALWRRYKLARRNPTVMRSLIEEASVDAHHRPPHH